MRVAPMVEAIAEEHAGCEAARLVRKIVDRHDGELRAVVHAGVD